MQRSRPSTTLPDAATRRRLAVVALIMPAVMLMACVALPTRARADEGMWLPTAPPRKLLESRYNFAPGDAWFEHLQKASVRFNNGGSGAFVSAGGLVVTNHHIGADSLQKLSPRGKDYYRDGYYARTPAEELKCPDLELNVLESVEDVTARVEAAVTKGMSPSDAGAARRAALSTIEKESLAATGLRSDVVTLYQGGAYHLYRYRKLTDVRLVFAPEHAVAAFGGDVDNFEYPRHGLDVCFFRVYDQGRALKPAHYLNWSPTPPSVGDLVFVSGNPGTTNRSDTVASLLHRRDVTLPFRVLRFRFMEAFLREFAERDPANASLAAPAISGYANARKAYEGQYQGLLDASILARKGDLEKALLERVHASPALRAEAGTAWSRIADIEHAFTAFEGDYELIERGGAFDARLFAIARHLVRLADEKPRSSAQRMREYRDSNLESLELELFSPAPVHADLERTRLAASLEFAAITLGAAHPVIQQALAGRSPATRAADLVAGTRLADPAERRRLYTGGRQAIDASQDPLIRLARAVDPEARRLRTRYENEVEEPRRQAYAQIARARFALEGTSAPPDATFTQRLAFGIVRGYTAEGVAVPPWTTLGGVFTLAQRHGGREPFALPRRWIDGRSRLDLSTPYDFVSTADTIGGNSGSPVVNRAGHLVGVNFDRNRYGLVRNFLYSEEQARHIFVSSTAVIEVLRVLYQAEPLLRELSNR